MANQGCVNEGPDTRLLGWLICPIQRFLNVRTVREPFSIFFTLYLKWYFLPMPMIGANIPLPRAGKGVWGVYRSLHLRLGFRYDFNDKSYLLSAAKTVNDRAIMY